MAEFIMPSMAKQESVEEVSEQIVPNVINASANNLGTSGNVNSTYVSAVDGTIAKLNGLVICNLHLTMKAVQLPINTAFVQLGKEYRPSAIKYCVFNIGTTNRSNMCGNLTISSTGEIKQVHNINIGETDTWFMNIVAVYSV